MKMLNTIFICIQLFLDKSIWAQKCDSEACRQKEDLRELVQAILLEQKEQRATINELVKQNAVMADTIRQHDMALQFNKTPIAQADNHAFGCMEDAIKLSCNVGYGINVTRAYYGRTPLNCTDDCCPPNADDCKELVANNSLVDWSILLNACNGNQNCSYTYEGAVINECREDYIADYMEILYDCLWYGDDHEPVSFSAYATESREYNDGDKVLFDGIVSNVGNHYNPTTSIFTCPLNGLYLFNVNVLAPSSYHMYVQIVYENKDLLGTYATSSSFSAAGASVVTKCNSGETVWVRCDFDGGYMRGDDASRWSHFTGALLQAYV